MSLLKFLSNVLKTLFTLGLHAEKEDKFRKVFQNIIFISQFMNCFITARGKGKIETTGISVKLFNMEFVSSFVSNRVSRKPSIQPKTRIDRVKMAQLSVSGTKCYFSHAGQGRQQLIPINSWVYGIKKHLRDVNVFLINLTNHANNRRRHSIERDVDLHVVIEKKNKQKNSNTLRSKQANKHRGLQIILKLLSSRQHEQRT